MREATKKEIEKFFITTISTAFEIHEENQDPQLQALYEEFKLADSIEAKLEIGTPLASVLGIGTLTYLPFCFFNIISPIMTLIFAWFMIKITRTKEAQAQDSEAVSA